LLSAVIAVGDVLMLHDADTGASDKDVRLINLEELLPHLFSPGSGQ
jgi:hypothetical protein